jgi:virulence-associated protein E/DNA primase RepB-like protein
VSPSHTRSSGGDTNEAVEFLRSRDPGGPWHLVSIVPDGPLSARTFNPEQLVELCEFIEARQERENLYVHVNPIREGVSNAKASKGDIAHAAWVHIDIDEVAAAPRLAEFAIPPTAVVFSGGGYNAYWKLADPEVDLERAESVNRWLVGKLVGDPAATDVSRILRLPGTVNLPTKKKRERGRTPASAYLVAELTDWSRQYEIDEFGEVTPGQSPSGKRRPTSDGGLKPVEVPEGVSDRIRAIILTGDDADRPRGGSDPRYRSRSEAVFAVACALAKLGCDACKIAGVLINPNYRISDSIREKRNPQAEALRQAQKARLAVGENWPEGKDRNGLPRRNFQNTQAALLRLGVEFWFDEFRQRMFVSGHSLQAFRGELNDRACLYLRDIVNKTFGFDPGKDMTRDAVEQLCNQNIVDPVREYLDGLVWDGVDRLDRWLMDYAGSDDTPYVRAVSRIALIAAVRRARKPGVKFDTILVLEGPQGTGKSTLINIMASDEFFSDQDILALDNKSQMEALEGIWIYELCELAGMRHTDVNKIKAFASRAVDRARPAYARFSEARPRRGIFVGTTNDDQYLKDETGNRRFWPIRTGAIDLVGLKAIRDQLWAEAGAYEAQGEPIVLDRDLWVDATLEQQKRVEVDGWEIALEGIGGRAFNGRELAPSKWLMEEVLGVSRSHVQGYHYKRLAKAMKALDWKGPTTITLPTGEKVKGYWRLTDRLDSHLPSQPRFPS